MPNFSFVVPTKKESVKRTSSASSSKYEILTKGVEGVVFINIDASYVIAVGEANYKITPENYSCKDISEIYCQLLKVNNIGHMNRVRIIRPKDECVDCNPHNYLPFTAGSCVKGNIVRHRASKNLYFKIKKVYFDSENTMARIAVRFYRQNYKDIMTAKINSYSDEDIEKLEKVFEDNNINVNDYKVVNNG